MNLPEKWARALDIVDMAFQVIIEVTSSKVVAYEALLRNYQEAGFESIEDFFHTAYKEEVLFSVDMCLREKTLKKFRAICGEGAVKLFYNIDNRVIEMNDYQSGKTIELLERMRIPQGCITFEISEKHRFKNFTDAKKAIDIYRAQGFSIALDDFGMGYSGLELLYKTDPEYVKVDRFFITNIENDPKKYHLLEMIVKVSKQLGFKVLAEGIETFKEFSICRNLGCDYAQGYYIEAPTTNIMSLKQDFTSLLEETKEYKQIG